MIRTIKSHEAREAWPMVEPVLARALARRGRYSSADVLERVEDQRMQLWLGESDLGDGLSVAITEVVVYPQAKEVRVVYAAGQLAPFQEAWPLVCSWAKELGARGVQVEGRAGWEHTIPGLRREGVLLFREV